jgi:hypothetical protein
MSQEKLCENCHSKPATEKDGFWSWVTGVKKYCTSCKIDIDDRRREEELEWRNSTEGRHANSNDNRIASEG